MLTEVQEVFIISTDTKSYLPQPTFGSCSSGAAMGLPALPLYYRAFDSIFLPTVYRSCVAFNNIFVLFMLSCLNAVQRS